MVLAGLGLNPAGVSLFRIHAPQSPLTSAWGLNPARVCHGFALLLTVSQMLFRQPVWGRSDYPLDLNPAEVALFRLWLQCAGVSLFVVALLGFSLLVVASSFCFFRPSERNVREFYGGWFWQVWAWILPTEPFDFRLRLESCQGLPWFCFAFNGFPDAVSAARLGTKWLPLGLESCWGCLVSLVVAMCWGFFVCGCTAGVFFACGCIIFLFL